MRRQGFVILLVGAAARQQHGRSRRAQQSGAMQRMDVLMRIGADDAEGQARIAALQWALQPLCSMPAQLWRCHPELELQRSHR
jgi:hypothetical protein